MPSPFPGMDPYLENPAYWSGFHTTFVLYLRSALSRVLPKGYFTEVEQHVWLAGEEEDDREPFAVPDSFVGTRAQPTAPALATLPSTAPTAISTAPNPVALKGPKFVKIVDQPGNRVITVIEVLSPANKTAGKDRDAYLAKRADYFRTGTNVVEIDLLLDGERLPMRRPKPPRADYYAFVCRADQFPKTEVWALTVRDPLPVLPTPLKPADGDVTVALRPCLDLAYLDAGYAGRIDYTAPPLVALSTADAKWARELLAARKGGA
jgi:hypothetical protein